MIDIAELRNENKEVLDLCNVLDALVGYQNFRENPVFCDLLARFAEKVKVHLSHEDHSLYSILLTHSDKKIRDTASHFLSNTSELKKLFTGYAKQWCKHSVTAEEHESFARETRDMFRIVKERIRMEDESLFPLLANLQS